jgi:hypothetical protein
VHTVSPDSHSDTQPGLILTALCTATTPLWQDELAQVPGVNRLCLAAISRDCVMQGT